MSTGAPPDQFGSWEISTSSLTTNPFLAADGQNWGFPTYNWEQMAKDNYKWWRGRLRQMSLYFHALRIDHVIGFFRIWEIPAYLGNSGLLGIKPFLV